MAGLIPNMPGDFQLETPQATTQPVSRHVARGFQIDDPFTLGTPFPDSTSTPVHGAQEDRFVAGTGKTPFRRSTAARIPTRTSMTPGGMRFGAAAEEHNANARLIAELMQRGFGTPRQVNTGGTRSTDPRGTQPTVQGNEAMAFIQNNGFGNPARRTGVAGSQLPRGTQTAVPQVSQPGVFDVFGGGSGITAGSNPFMNAFRGRF